MRRAKTIFNAAFPVRLKQTGIEGGDKSFRFFHAELHLFKSGIAESDVDNRLAKAVSDQAFLRENDSRGKPLTSPIRITPATTKILVRDRAANAFVREKQSFAAKLLNKVRRKFPDPEQPVEKCLCH